MILFFEATLALAAFSFGMAVGYYAAYESQETRFRVWQREFARNLCDLETHVYQAVQKGKKKDRF